MTAPAHVELPDLSGDARGVLLLLAVAVLFLSLGGIRLRAAAFLAVARGGIQLAVLSIILTGVISHPIGVGVALSVMFGVAVATTGRRVGQGWAGLGITLVSLGSGVIVAMAIVFGSGAADLQPRYVLAVGGIVIGGAMTVGTISGRRLISEVSERWGEVEAMLALGATARQATGPMARTAAREALIPSLDQTRTTGLVTLPGAFVGAIFGGLDPIDAGRFQLIVLAAILCAGSISAVMMVRMLSSRARLLKGPE